MPAVSRPGDGDWAARRLLPPSDGYATFDRIAVLAARLLGAPSAQVSLLTDVQTIAGAAGQPDEVVGSQGPLAHSLCTVTAAQAAPLAVVDAPSDPRVNTLPPVTTGQVGSYLGVPLTADSGDVVGALCVFGAQPRTWTGSEIVVLENLAEFVRAELELAALGREVERDRVRWDLAVQAGDIGSFDWDLVTDHLGLDDRLVAICGRDAVDETVDDAVAEHSLAEVMARVHPEDRSLVEQATDTAIGTGDQLRMTFRIVRPDGRMRWLEARGRALTGSDGVAHRLVGVAWDVTEQHDAEARAERVLAGMTVGYLALDADWRMTYVNAEGSRLLGATSAELLGRSIWERFPGTIDSEFGATYRRVATSGRTETVEAFYPAPLNAWYEVRVVAEGSGVALYFLDITARKRTMDLLQLSVDVSEHLVGAVGVDDAVAAMASMVVPGLADCSIVTLVDADGTMRDVRSWHADPSLRSAVEQYVAVRPAGGASGAVAEVMRTREPVAIAARDIALAAGRLTTDDARQRLATLTAGSAVVVPMLAGDTVAGMLTLCRDIGREPMSDHELAVTESVCRRAGLAIENARLNAARAVRAEHDRTVAEALQRALLTRLPNPERLTLAARYLTAADGDQVGGDWYDAIDHGDGAVTLMIGDVVGHDIVAAASMGQLRTMLRMLALRRDDAPSTMLSELDHAARQLDVRTFATVVAARVEPDGEGLWTVRWSNAGHPPPIVVRADGSTDVLQDPDPDVMLGVDEDASRREHTCVLPTGAALVFYTDGLVESRDAGIDAGIDALRASLTRHRAAGIDSVLDLVLADIVGPRPDDDVAVIMARLA